MSLLHASSFGLVCGCLWWRMPTQIWRCGGITGKLAASRANDPGMDHWIILSFVLGIVSSLILGIVSSLYDAELLCGGLGLDARQMTRAWLIGSSYHEYLAVFPLLCDADFVCGGLVLHAAVVMHMLHVSDNTSPYVTVDRLTANIRLVQTATQDCTHLTLGEDMYQTIE